MWIRTHYYMARHIYNYIKEKYQLSLRLDKLQYGSVKPDMHWRYNNISHYYEDGFAFWQDEVRKLLKKNNDWSINEFSDQLGVILHFTADFFCYAHNTKELRENTWLHLLYELRLNKAFINHQPYQAINLLNSDDPYLIISSYRHAYLSSDTSIENDICFIYTASLSIADLLVKKVFLPIRKEQSLAMNSLLESS